MLNVIFHLLQCVPECNSGYQEREVNCTDSNGNLWDHKFCIDLARPPSTRPCNSGPCFYSWHMSEWSQVACHAQIAMFLKVYGMAQFSLMKFGPCLSVQSTEVY